MYRFNRLYWKVFLSLWLSSFVVMMVTVIVIGELAEEDNFKSKVDYRVRLEAQRFLDRYEADPSQLALLERRKKRRDEKSKAFWDSGHKAGPSLVIKDDQGQVILGAFNEGSGKRHKIKVISDSGRVYKVHYRLNPPPNSLARWHGFIFSVQALLILLSSTIASFIVSAIVVRPMNQLRQYVKRLQAGEYSVRIENKLQLRGDEIGDFAREFNQMAEHVEGTLKRQQQLFQNVSHELRAPLARLLAASGIIEQQVGDGHPAVSRVQLECERLSCLIDELLALAKLQQQEHGEREFDVMPLLYKLVEDISFSQVEREIVLTQDKVSSSLVLGSSALLERAVGNVLGNALKHTDQNSQIAIRVSCTDRKHLQIVIEDNGPGVAEHLIDRLCEPFFRLDTNVDGHGLGLGIAKQAMQTQQGDLLLEQVDPNGLRVKLILKLK
jgi:signal transduction histidine kinase